MYCVKCETKTPSLNAIHVLSANGKKLLKAKCSVCGKNQSTFVKASFKGDGFSMNDLINNLPIEFHQYAKKEKTYQEVRSMICKNILSADRGQNTNSVSERVTVELMN